MSVLFPIKKLFFIQILIALIIAIVPARVSAAIDTSTVFLCETSPSYAPFVFADEQGVITGYAVEFLTKVFAQHGLKLNPALMPWKRCLLNLKVGKSTLTPIGAYNDERAQFVYYFKPFVKVTLSYVYSSKRYPLGLKLSRLSDMKNYKVCGRLGFDYSKFKLGNIKINSQAKSFNDLMQRVQRGRSCDLFLIRHQVLVGMVFDGEKIPQDIKSMPMPEVQPEWMHVMVSKKSPIARYVLRVVNQGLDEFLGSPFDTQLKKKYGLDD